MGSRERLGVAVVCLLLLVVLAFLVAGVWFGWCWTDADRGLRAATGGRAARAATGGGAAEKELDGRRGRDVRMLRLAAPAGRWLAERRTEADRGRLPLPGARTATAPAGRSVGRAVVELAWDQEEGAFTLELPVGRRPVTMVLDTGSPDLTVKGSNCEWERCYASLGRAKKAAHGVSSRIVSRDAGNHCVLQPCPCGKDASGRAIRDCSQHAYVPSRAAKMLTRVSRQTLTYGSQTNQVRHYAEPLELAGETAPLQVVVHQIHKVKGDTSSNIAGFALHYEPGRDHLELPALAPTLLEALGVSEFTVRLPLGFDRGQVVLGPEPVPRNATTVPLLDLRTAPEGAGLRDSNVRFYAVRLHGLRVDGGPWESSGVPPVAVLDTGTTNSYADPALWDTLVRLGWKEGPRQSLSLLLDGGQELTWTRDMLRDIDDPRGSPVHFDADRGIPNFRDMFNGADFVMIGVSMMVGRAWNHNLADMIISTWKI